MLNNKVSSLLVVMLAVGLSRAGYIPNRQQYQQQPIRIQVEQEVGRPAVGAAPTRIGFGTGVQSQSSFPEQGLTAGAAAPTRIGFGTAVAQPIQELGSAVRAPASGIASLPVFPQTPQTPVRGGAAAPQLSSSLPISQRPQGENFPQGGQGQGQGQGQAPEERPLEQGQGQGLEQGQGPEENLPAVRQPRPNVNAINRGGQGQGQGQESAVPVAPVRPLPGSRIASAPVRPLGQGQGQGQGQAPLTSGGSRPGVAGPGVAGVPASGVAGVNQEFRTPGEEEEEAQRLRDIEYIKNAKYTFATAVDDGIMDQSQVRQETRDGEKVTGSYSYSDGFVKRTVKYQADADGFKILSEESTPIGNGPQVDLKSGRADVHTQSHTGVDTQYSLNAGDIDIPASHNPAAPKV